MLFKNDYGSVTHGSETLESEELDIGFCVYYDCDCWSTHFCFTKKRRKSPVFLENTGLFAGPSEKIRTSGLLNPIQARYQLRYTRIFYLLK